MTLSFINVFIGFILANWGWLQTRSKIGGNTPAKFSFLFWFKDNWIKVLHSLATSCLLNLAVQLNLSEVKHLTGFEWRGIYSIIIGFAPDLILSVLKDRLGILQPKRVKLKDKIYERKEN